MDQMLHVSSNPHVRDKMTTSKIMQLVVLALLPATLFGIYNFGLRALLVVVITVASSVFFEWIYDKLMHKKNTITDFSAVVTGLLLALNMPASIPLWMPVLGSAFAIIVVKTALRWSGTELHEPGTCRKMFPDDLFRRKDDRFRSKRQLQRCGRYCIRCNSSGSSETEWIYRQFCICITYVYR